MHLMNTGWAILVACMGSLALSCSGGEEPTPDPSGAEKVAPVIGSMGYVVLSGADAAAGATPAPAKYSSCATCHGPAGQGTVIAPEVRHIPTPFSSHVIRNGRLDANNMQTAMVANSAAAPAPAGGQVLTDAEVAELAGWLNSHPKPVTGDALYKDFCGNCHGPAMASGGSVGVKLLAGISTATVNSAVRTGYGAVTGPRTTYMPAFDTTLLTDQELGLIATFIGAK
jgi:mono/diheme cytochrome c family protein